MELGRVPRVAAVLNDVEARGEASKARTLADLFELRIDAFDPPTPSHAVEVCREARAAGVPVIATVRARDEGGVAELTDGARLALFEAVLPLVDALDVEFHAKIRKEIVALAHRAGKPVIVSFHDFAATPRDDDLVAILDAAKLSGADVVKIATTIGSTEDLERLLGLLFEHRRKGLILIGMGAAGAASRVLFPLFGSLITYGFLHQAAAPGQLRLDDLVREIERYVPDFAAERRRRAASAG